MNTTVRGLRRSRIAILAAMLAIIAGICTLFCTGAQQSAWAEESGKTIFTSGSISSLPFTKTIDGITVDIFAEEDEADTVEADASDPVDETDADEEGTSSKESSSSSSSSSAKSAASTVTIEITADEDIEAVKVVIDADGKEITKDIPGKMLEADDTVTFTLDNCTKVSKLTIYGPEDKKEAGSSNATDASKDADSNSDAADASKDDADDSESGITFTSEDDAADASDEGTDGDESDNGITITPVDKEDGDDDVDLDAESEPLKVFLIDDDNSANNHVIYVEAGKAFNTGTLEIGGTETVSIADFDLIMDDKVFVGWEINGKPGEFITDDTIIEEETYASPIFEDYEELPLSVILNDESAPNGGYIVYVENGEPFGTGKLDTASDETVSIKDFNPTKEGYKFTGKWTINGTGEELADSTIITSDITADPVFEPVKQQNNNTGNSNNTNNTKPAKTTKVTVTYDMNGHGDVAKTSDVVTKGSCVPAFDNPTEKGWIFERWITEDEQTFIPGYTPVNKDMTVYAIWAQDIPVDRSKAIDASKDDKDKDESKTFSIVVSKVSAEDGTCLKGAEFVLKDKSGNVIGSWTSGESGMVIDGLKKDTTYVLNETKAPDGYGIEKPININFVEENGKASVKIDQGGSAVVPLATNNDGIAALNVKDAPGKSKSASTTMPLTGDNQNLPLAGLCFGGAAAVAAAVAFMAYRKRKLA
ncbi:MAG: SpaA isopeptide-forming pilin-related protein [Eggerthellaceae bacterium]